MLLCLRRAGFPSKLTLHRSIAYPRCIVSHGIHTSGWKGSEPEYRTQIAPWISVGQFQKGVLAHMSISEILRAMLVFHLCSYDFIVDRNAELFKLSQKFGKLGEWVVRKTFFNQFVGGDTVSQMTRSLNALHARGLKLMILPVVESDLDDDPTDASKYEKNMRSLESIVKMTGSFGKQDPVFQLKLSAIISPKTLEAVTKSIPQFHSALHPDSAQQAKLIDNLVESINNPNVLALKLDPVHRNHILEGLKRADSLVQLANKLSVKVLVDAEFYSCQAAISRIALALMARYNRNGYVVGNTTQGYLKESRSKIEAELNVITKEFGVSWFGKIVRGAYMDRERLLASKLGIDSPVCDSYEATSESYNATVAFVLKHLSQNKANGSHLVVATHNEKSVRLAAQQMKDLEIGPQDNLVSFAQIYGMADYLSTPLVNQNYNVYKSAPYGPMESVFPYLGRRAAENRAVLQGAREERVMLWKRLRSRLAPFQ